MTKILLVITIACCSCTKYLDKKTNAGLTVPTKLSDYQALLDDPYRMNSNGVSISDGCADAHFAPNSRFRQMDDNQKQAYVWNYPQYRFADWANAYGVVFNGNFCIEGIEKIPQTPENNDMWKNVKGSAHFFKAFMYMQLLWAHAKAYDVATANNDLGIVLRVGTDFSVPSIRSTVAEGYSEVLHNAHEALANLPLRSINVFRPSKIAAYGLLARTFLSMRMYDSAFFYADRFLAEKNDLLDFNRIQVDARRPFRSYDATEVVFHSRQSGSAVSSAAVSNNCVDTMLVASYALNDLRRRAYFTPRNGYLAFKGTYAENQFALFDGFATNEIFIIRAECHARAGRTTEAMADLNHLLRFRFDASFIPLTANNAAEALQIVLRERKKELLFRGLRWIDIKRYNLEGAGIVLTRVMEGRTYTLPPNDPRYAIPLPHDIVEITGIPQN